MKSQNSLFSPYEIDSSQVVGKATEVFLPSTVEEVKQIVRTNPKICIRGGGTGLAGGAVPQGEAVLDLSKLNQIGNFDKERKTIEVGAGILLDELNEYLEKEGLEFPINPSSHAIATIGGMIATDAVGSRAIKYGRTSKWIKWLEIVNSQGEIEKKGITELSDYSGMEGITGVIVRACLNLSPKKIRTASLFSYENLDEVISAIASFKRESNVSMIEFIDKRISEWVGMKPSHHLLVEYENGSGDYSGENYSEIMLVRDKIYPVLANKGYTRIEDPQMISDKAKNIIDWLEEKEIPVFGHLSVGILHPCFNKKQEKLIPQLIKAVKRLGGKVSGEHGIGVLKKEFVEPNDKKILVNIKKRTDPANKFNVGKVI